MVDIDGDPHAVLTPELTAVLRGELWRQVGSLARHRDAIRRALDVLLVGF